MSMHRNTEVQKQAESAGRLPGQPLPVLIYHNYINVSKYCFILSSVNVSSE